MKNTIKLFLALAALMLSACRGGARELTVMTHDSFAASEAVVQAFETQYDVKVKFLSAGDAGAALNKAILSKDKPMADVFYGVDNTFLSRALDESIFLAYDSPLLTKIPGQFQLDAQNRALPVDYGDVCLNYDKAYSLEKGSHPRSRSKIYSSRIIKACWWWRIPPPPRQDWYSCWLPSGTSAQTNTWTSGKG